MYDSLNKQNIYNNTQIKLIIEFFSPLSRNYLARKLSKVLRKKIIYSDKYLVRSTPSNNTFQLIPEISGGFRMNKIVTGFIQYNEAIHIMLKSMNFINECGYTTDRSRMKVGVRFNIAQKIENLNIFKFMLNLDEPEILNEWNNSSISKIYKNNLAYIYPKNLFISDINLSIVSNLGKHDFIFPKSKYFGMNFETLKNNYVDIRYINGKNYHKKTKKSVDLINNIIEKLYNTLEDTTYSDIEKSQMVRILREQKRIVSSIKNLTNLKENYPELVIFVDLKKKDQFLKQIYDNIRYKLFELIVYGNIKKGIINFDTNRGKFQVKESKIKNGFLINDMEFYESLIEGDINESLFYDCAIKSSNLTNSILKSYNKIKYSYIENCKFDGSEIELENCYIDNKPEFQINANIKNCIIRNGIISYDSEVDEETELLIDKSNK